MAIFCERKSMKIKYSNQYHNKDDIEAIKIKEGNYNLKNKENNKILFKKNINSMFLFQLIIIIIFLSLSQEQKYNLRNLDYYSKITLIIKNTGRQEIIYNKFQFKPCTVIVNGISVSPVNDEVLLDEEKDNVIVLMFDTIINSTNNMFRNNNMKSIDLSEFDFS
jgi:hypothetical protein